MTRYRRALADDANPAERGVGLREWGSGEASIASAALVGHEGTDRLQFLSGEPFELQVAVEADGIPPPRLQLELRDDAGTLVAGHAVDLRSIGWAAGNGHRDVRFHIGALPLADGRFHLRLGLTDEAGEHVYHWLDDALVFVVYPGDDMRGVVRFEGTWMLEEKSRNRMSARTCPDWPELMELDPDLQFKHYTVAEAQLPAESLSRISHVSLGDVEICCDLEHHVFNPGHTDLDVAEALRGTHWFDVREWATSGPGVERVLLERRLTTLRRVPAIVIPYRGDAKRRLASSRRAALALAMLGDVVEAAVQVGRVLVVTDDASVVPPGVEVVDDPGRGLAAAVAAALDVRRRACARRERRPSGCDARCSSPARRRRAGAGRGRRRNDERALPSRSVRLCAPLRPGKRRSLPGSRRAGHRPDTRSSSWTWTRMPTSSDSAPASASAHARSSPFPA